MGSSSGLLKVGARAFRNRRDRAELSGAPQRPFRESRCGRVSSFFFKRRRCLTDRRSLSRERERESSNVYARSTVPKTRETGNSLPEIYEYTFGKSDTYCREERAQRLNSRVFFSRIRRKLTVGERFRNIPTLAEGLLSSRVRMERVLEKPLYRRPVEESRSNSLEIVTPLALRAAGARAATLLMGEFPPSGKIQIQRNKRQIQRHSRV